MLFTVSVPNGIRGRIRRTAGAAPPWTWVRPCYAAEDDLGLTRRHRPGAPPRHPPPCSELITPARPWPESTSACTRPDLPARSSTTSTPRRRHRTATDDHAAAQGLRLEQAAVPPRSRSRPRHLAGGDPAPPLPSRDREEIPRHRRRPPDLVPWRPPAATEGGEGGSGGPAARIHS